jgi:NTP pyrophosphatase (non-canonical NTP hydrolase)
MTLQELQEHTQAVRAAKGWGEISLERRMLFLMSEVGEAARELLALSGEYAVDDLTAVKEKLGLELFDLLWNVADMANLLGVDLEAVAAKKVKINWDREW